MFTGGIGVHFGANGHLMHQDRGESPILVGMHLRAKLLRIIGLQVDYSGPEGGDDPTLVTDLSTFTVVPSLTLAMTLEPVPNRWFSPFLIGGYGWDLSKKSRPTAIVVGGGFEIPLTQHWALHAEVRFLLPTPQTATAAVQSAVTAQAASEKKSKLSDASPTDVYSVESYQILLSVRFYL